MADPAVDVAEDPDRRRYTLTLDGQPAGFAAYVDRAGRRLFVHTEIDPGHEGQGLGSQLVAGALEDVRRRGIPVVPLCPFVARYIEGHPEHADLVDHGFMEALDRH